MNREKIKKIIAGLCVTGAAVSFSAGIIGHISWDMFMERFYTSGVDVPPYIERCLYIVPAGTAVCGLLFIAMMIYLNRAVACYNSERFANSNSEQTGLIRTLRDSVSLLQEEYALTERTNKAKSTFMSRMSHDLRTPMNAIVGYSMLTEQAADDPEKVGYYAQKIIMSGRILMELINDILDMSCIETGNIKLLTDKFSLKSVFDEVGAAVKPQTDSKNQKFNCYLNNSVHKDLIVGDKQRLCQIMRNILSNAVKYTPEGGNIDFMVNVIDGSNGKLQVLCQVRDNGCGMSRTFMKKLFDPFAREDNELNPGVQSTGLGMCITRSLVELMNGSISVESEENAGTLVTVVIPFEVAVEEQITVKCVFENEDALKGLRILAAEDNELNAEILHEVLTAMGAECVIAGDGQEAVALFEMSEPDHYDMILMDIQMPVMNGYQAAAAIRKSRHPNGKDIVIIAMTADAFEEDVQKAFVSGMNAHVAKPLNLKSFINTVKSLNIGI